MGFGRGVLRRRGTSGATRNLGCRAAIAGCGPSSCAPTDPAAAPGLGRRHPGGSPRLRGTREGATVVARGTGGTSSTGDSAFGIGDGVVTPVRPAEIGRFAP